MRASTNSSRFWKSAASSTRRKPRRPPLGRAMRRTLHDSRSNCLHASNDSCHRRRRVYWLGARSATDSGDGRPRGDHRPADVRRAPGEPHARPRRPAAYARGRGHRRCGCDARRVSAPCAGRRHAPGRGVARGPVDRRTGGVHSDEHRRDVHAAGSRPRALRVAERRGRPALPLPPRLDRRGLRRARRRGGFSRDDAV